MRIQSKRLGTVDVDEADIIEFPSGLVGLGERRRFVLMEFGDGIPLGWLQDVDDGDFGLPVGDPGLFVPEYNVEVGRGEIAELDLSDLEDAVLLVVTTIAAGGTAVTGNLRAPLVVNLQNRRARQVVLDTDLPLRAPVDPVAFAAARTEAPVPEAVTNS